MTYAFTFDASACSGCKACQIACKDKNNLPTGVLWRRVFEVSGGTWTQQDDAWTNNVFSYNLSIACNHCEHPKCAGVCPTDAYVTRADGIVYIDESKCMGCGYCSWACPYAAPRYNPQLGHMTKCNFCMDNLDAGLPPACVAACPMRVLDFVTVGDGQQTTDDKPRTMGDGLSFVVNGQKLWEIPGTEHPFPLPPQSRTEPHLAIRPHAGMLNGLEKTVSNREEVKPPRSKVGRLWSPKSLALGVEELPLLIFTLCGQTAAGMALFALFGGPLSIPLLTVIGGLIAVGGLASFLHLGSPWNAWRALNHLNKSWLSREILAFGLFGASWLIALALPGMGKLPLALTGLALVYVMAQVYHLRSMPSWNTWRTPVGFFATALVLGLTLMWNILGFETQWAGMMVAALLALELGGWLGAKSTASQAIHNWRGGLIAAGILGAGIGSAAAGPAEAWTGLVVFLIVLAESILGRWEFYAALDERVLG